MTCRLRDLQMQSSSKKLPLGRFGFWGSTRIPHVPINRDLMVLYSGVGIIEGSWV